MIVSKFRPVARRRLSTPVRELRRGLRAQPGNGALHINAPLPRLEPYPRCACGVCPECRMNAKWDRIFAKFEVKEQEDRKGFFRSPLNDL